jgi:hypothetical protein
MIIVAEIMAIDGGTRYLAAFTVTIRAHASCGNTHQAHGHEAILKETGMKLIGKPLTAVLAAASAAIVLAPMALASASGGAAARPAAIPPDCGNAHPALPDGAFVWGSSLGDGFAGGAGYVLEITNEGRHACSLRGAPGVAVERNGHLVGGKVPASGKSPLVTLKPGATAYFTLIIHDAGAACQHPVNGTVLIYLPGQRQAQDGRLGAQACPGLPIGKLLSPGTIHLGTGVPLYNG